MSLISTDGYRNGTTRMIREREAAIPDAPQFLEHRIICIIIVLCAVCILCS
jgi:hypothetical protein